MTNRWAAVSRSLSAILMSSTYAGGTIATREGSISGTTWRSIGSKVTGEFSL